MRSRPSGFLVIAVGPDTAMQLHILSDPHIEFEAFYPPAVETTYVCVFHEIATADPDAPGASDVRTAPWIRRRPVVNRPLVASLRLELDPGEAEAIACAVEANAKLLLIDERRGRLVALRLASATTGLMGGAAGTKPGLDRVDPPLVGSQRISHGTQSGVRGRFHGRSLALDGAALSPAACRRSARCGGNPASVAPGSVP